MQCTTGIFVFSKTFVAHFPKINFYHETFKSKIPGRSNENRATYLSSKEIQKEKSRIEIQNDFSNAQKG